jgi:two-component system, sensor histidine kinase and response regulator
MHRNPVEASGPRATGLGPRPAPSFYSQWIMLALFVTLIGVLGLYSILQQRKLIESNERDRLQAQARVVDKNLGKQLEAANFALQGLLNDMPLFRGTAGLRAADHRMKALSDAMPGIRTMFLVDATGRITASNRSELLGRDLGYRDYFTVPRRNPDPALLYVSPPFKTVLGAYLINLTRIIPGPHGEFNGVVSAAIDPDFFNILLSSVLYAPDMRSGVIHHDGLRILMVPESTALTGKDLSNPASFFSRHLASGRQENIETGTSYSTGDRRMTALRNIETAGLRLDKTLTVTISRDCGALFAGWRHTALAEGALLAILTLAAAAGLYLFQRRQKSFDRQTEKTESALKDSATRYQSLLRSATDGIHIIDKSGKVVEASHTFSAMLGYSEEEAATLHVWDFDLQWSAEELLQVVKDLIATPATFQTRQRRRDGTIIDVEISARGVRLGGEEYLYAASRDITSRKLEEKELDDSRQRMMNIIDFLPDATFVIDLEGKVIAWNKAMEEMSGISKEQMIGQGDYAYTIPFYGERRPQLLDLLDMADAELEAHYGEVQRQGDTLFAEVFVPAVYQGKGAHVWAIGAPLYDSKGKRTGAIESIRNITERKRAESELQQAKELAEASALSKSQFLANMSHEIRTPMNAILGLTRLTLETALSELQRDYLFKVQSSSRALLNLLNDILDYSKIEAGRLELENIDFELDAVLHSLSDLFSYSAEEKGVEIFYEVGPEVPRGLKGDPLRLGQILSNLIGNAVKFTAQGEIHVKAQCVELNEREILLRFLVRDTGIGIEPEQCEALFHAFSQLDSSISRNYGGTGLGLAISKRLVHLMGGEIGVQSEPGRGSTFRFTVRLQRSPASLSLRDPRNLRGMRALVVDDQETSRDILKRILESWSFEVATGASGEEAIALILQASRAKRPFELVLLDWKMPGIDGLEVLRLVQQEIAAGELQCSPTVIMVSGYSKDQLLESAAGTPLDDILIKPVTSSSLFDSVIAIQSGKAGKLPRQVMDQRLQLNRKLACIAGARILLVEDNLINQLVAVESLKSLGFEVEVAWNGRESVEMAARKNYDAILMDLQMPEMDGFEATRLIRATPAGKNIPIIALTAAAMVQEKEACLAAGMNDHVAKPIDPAALANALLAWIGTGDGALGVAADERQVLNQPELSGPLAGFDLDAALRRLNGNRGLLARLLRAFADDLEVLPSELRASLDAGDFAKAANRMHALKGIAGNLGAAEVLAATTKLELELKGGHARSLPEFEAGLQSAAAAIRGSVTLRRAEIDVSCALNPAAAAQLFDQLQGLIESCALVSDDLQQELQETLHGHVPEPLLGDVLRQLNAFQHEEALASLSQIAALIGVAR